MLDEDCDDFDSGSNIQYFRISRSVREEELGYLGFTLPLSHPPKRGGKPSISPGFKKTTHTRPVPPTDWQGQLPWWGWGSAHCLAGEEALSFLVESHTLLQVVS